MKIGDEESEGIMDGILGVCIVFGVVLVIGVGRYLWKKKRVRQIYAALIAVLFIFIGIVNLITGELGVFSSCLIILGGLAAGYVIFFEDELKKKGVSLLEDKVGKNEEAIITVRGKKKYVIISMAKYNQYREYELNAAIIETRKDIKEGNFIIESVDDHIKRLKKNL